MRSLQQNQSGPVDRLREAIHHSVGNGNAPIHAERLPPCAIQLQKISGGTGPHNPMGPHRSTGGFHRIDAQQFGCHAGAQEAAPLNRSTVEPLGLKRTNRNTAVDQAGVRCWVLQLEQSRCPSGANDPLLLGRRAIDQLLNRSFGARRRRSLLVTDSAESED